VTVINSVAATATTTSILPTDHHYVSTAVLERRRLTVDDETYLVQQLGYLPGNALQVVARAKAVPRLCPNHPESPLVLQLYPLVQRNQVDGKSTKWARKRTIRQPQSSSSSSQQPNETTVTVDQEDESSSVVPDNSNVNDKDLQEPFPTIYWLTHLRLQALISQLELDHVHIEYEQRLQLSAVSVDENNNDNNHCFESMKRAHASYGQERRLLLTELDCQVIHDNHWEAAFATGVAGIRNPRGVKCLHAHAAHYLSGATDKCVGQWVMERVVAKLRLLDET
jgi:hypothetical protein